MCPGRHRRRDTDHRSLHRRRRQHTAVIPIAGESGANDIAVACAPDPQCRGIKIQIRLCPDPARDPEETIEARAWATASRRLMRQTLSEVVEPRYEELFN